MASYIMTVFKTFEVRGFISTFFQPDRAVHVIIASFSLYLNARVLLCISIVTM